MERGTLKISQPTYAIQLVEEYGVKKRKSIPLSAGTRLGSLDENEITGNWPFRELVGALIIMWLSTQTRPDGSNAVRAVQWLDTAQLPSRCTGKQRFLL